jgi:hypothetical protein
MSNELEPHGVDPGWNDKFVGFLLGGACIGVSWASAFLIPVGVKSDGPFNYLGEFWLRWAVFFLLFGGITLFILRRREEPTAGFFLAGALFLLLDGVCWGALR